MRGLSVDAVHGLGQYHRRLHDRASGGEGNDTLGTRRQYHLNRIYERYRGEQGKSRSSHISIHSIPSSR